MPNPKYYLTLFKLEGHTKWRAFLGTKEDSFEKIKAHDNWPEVTEKIVHTVDRVTGEMMLNIN